jgi:hypothetical protein
MPLREVGDLAGARCIPVVDAADRVVIHSARHIPAKSAVTTGDYWLPQVWISQLFVKRNASWGFSIVGSTLYTLTA